MASSATIEKDPQEKEAALRSKVNEITNLLPSNECTAADLRDELGLLPGDVKKLEESGRVPARIDGRVQVYKTFAAAREIVAQGIPWKRTQLSLDRERLTFDELFEYHTLYPSGNIELDTGVDKFNLAAAMELSDVRKIPGHVAGGTIARALRNCRKIGIRVFVSGSCVRSAVERHAPKPLPAAPPLNPVDAAIAQHRAKLRQEREDREFGLLVEYGRLVQLRGDLSNEQADRLGEIAVTLGYDGEQYRRDVAILERVEYLQSINSEAVQRKARKAMDAATEKRKALEREQLEIPRKIQLAWGESQQARNLFNESIRAEADIAELTGKHSHLFQDAAEPADNGE